MDGEFVEKIVHEVKSQGIFDEFRRDSMADVDTKPAYQNLQQRVENSVKKFLADQKWSSDINKNQLREKLRRHIAESGYLDVGVERIVDQVVNPKIGSVFRPRIEEIVYKYLGIIPPPIPTIIPPPPVVYPLPPLPMSGPGLRVDTSNLLPNDLEQVSPDSDKATVQSEGKENMKMGESTMEYGKYEDLMSEDDEESPPFEPLESENLENSTGDCKIVKIYKKVHEYENDISIPQESEIVYTDKEVSRSIDIKIASEYQLSNVSNDSFSTTCKTDSVIISNSQEEVRTANISEEAQMPKFNENSNEIHISMCMKEESDDNINKQLHFDIKKADIKFEGTERNTNLIEKKSLLKESPNHKPLNQISTQYISTDSRSSFKFDSSSFSKGNNNLNEEDVLVTFNNTKSGFESYLEDTSISAAQLTINSEFKDYDKDMVDNIDRKLSIQNIKETPNNIPCLSTPSTTSTPSGTPYMTPTNTSSPLTMQSLREKEHINKYSSSLSKSKHGKHSKYHKRSHKHLDTDHNKDNQHRHSNKTRSNHGKKSKHHHTRSDSAHRCHSKHSSSSSTNSKNSLFPVHKSTNSRYFDVNTLLIKHHSSKDSSVPIEHKKDKDKDYKKSHHFCSNTNKERMHNLSSVRVKENKVDDHNEVKNKTITRRSNDSNDEDKSMGYGNNYGLKTKTTEKPSTMTSTNMKSKTKSNDINQKTVSSENSKLELIQHCNVVILNEMLADPQINFIDLDMSSFRTAPVQADISRHGEELKYKKSSDESKLNDSDDSNESDLLYFEDLGQVNPFNEKLKMLNKILKMYCYEYDTTESETPLTGEAVEVCSDDEKKVFSKVMKDSDIGKITASSHVATRIKKIESMSRKQNTSNKCSKTPPMISKRINTKENDIDKNQSVFPHISCMEQRLQMSEKSDLEIGHCFKKMTVVYHI